MIPDRICELHARAASHHVQQPAASLVSPQLRARRFGSAEAATNFPMHRLQPATEEKSVDHTVPYRTGGRLLGDVQLYNIYMQAQRR